MYDPLNQLYEKQDDICKQLAAGHKGQDYIELITEYMRVKALIRKLEGWSITRRSTYTLNDEKPVKKKVKK